jgi:uncharacterized protein (DUF2141 family)
MIVVAVALALSTIATPGPAAYAAGADVIRISVVGLHSDSGRVVCTLFDSPTGFPRDDTKAQTISVPIVHHTGTCDFPVSTRGRYATVVFHDENADGKFNTNWLGLPKEGYGFSNDVSISWRPPNFDEAAFKFKGGTQGVTIHIRY